MKTEILPVDAHKPGKDALNKAAEVLRRGGIVVFPTDTVYGLAVSAFNKEAQVRLYRLKGRLYRKPLIIMPRDIASLELIADIPPHARKLMKKFWPGPLTLVLPATPLGRIVMGGRADLGARIPDNRVALELLKCCDFPLATTSANPSSRPSAKSAREAERYFRNKAEVILDAGLAPLGKESTVIDATHFHCVVLREGILPSKELLPHLV
ncbi:MAG: L-threonylcarbamoyladenylate synthase [Endomicrobiales bacterium]